MAGGERAVGVRSGTPRGELTRIAESRERRAEEAHGRILEAMLVSCGESGYRRVAVQDAIDRCGGNRVQFYRHFASKADCFTVAHEVEIERLAARVLGAAEAAQAWPAGVRVGLEELAAFATESPLLARGLLVEILVAGGLPLGKRAEVLKRFEHALERARDEAGVRPPPPSLAAAFLVGAVESALIDALLTGEVETFASAVPELSHAIVSTYLGEEAAAEELAAAMT
jgi:AcrR family transcriptional regulator